MRQKAVLRDASSRNTRDRLPIVTGEGVMTISTTNNGVLCDIQANVVLS